MISIAKINCTPVLEVEYFSAKPQLNFVPDFPTDSSHKTYIPEIVDISDVRHFNNSKDAIEYFNKMKLKASDEFFTLHICENAPVDWPKPDLIQDWYYVQNIDAFNNQQLDWFLDYNPQKNKNRDVTYQIQESKYIKNNRVLNIVFLTDYFKNIPRIILNANTEIVTKSSGEKGHNILVGPSIDMYLEQNYKFPKLEAYRLTLKYIRSTVPWIGKLSSRIEDMRRNFNELFYAGIINKPLVYFTTRDAFYCSYFNESPFSTLEPIEIINKQETSNE